MAAAFNSQMTAEDLAKQLNVMSDELKQRFRDNDQEHQRLRDAVDSVSGKLDITQKTLDETIEAMKAEVGSLGGKIGNVQQSLETTTGQARVVIETLATESRAALEAVRGEGLVSLQSAMQKHEADLRTLYDTLVSQVSKEFIGVRAELDATQAGLVQAGGLAAAAAAHAAGASGSMGPGLSLQAQADSGLQSTMGPVAQTGADP